MANPIVTIEMENGDIMKAELYPEIAPNTVNNFISLIKSGYYDGLIFHRGQVSPIAFTVIIVISSLSVLIFRSTKKDITDHSCNALVIFS